MVRMVGVRRQHDRPEKMDFRLANLPPYGISNRSECIVQLGSVLTTRLSQPWLAATTAAHLPSGLSNNRPCVQALINQILSNHRD